MRSSIVVALLLLGGCAVNFGPAGTTPVPRRALQADRSEISRCSRLSTGAEGPYRVPLAEAETDPRYAAVLDPLPADLRRALLAAGLEPGVARLLLDRPAPGVAPDYHSIARRQAVAVHLSSLKVQTDALSFEVDCTGDFVESLSAQLEDQRGHREIRLTVASIIVGAAGTVAAGIWALKGEEETGPVVVDIVGATAATTLGVTAFIPPERAVFLEHARNLLRPIVDGEDPDHIYPTFVFRLLTLPGPDGTSIRDGLVTRFDQILRDAVSEADIPRAEALIYGEGGVYSATLLAVREHMFDELEIAVGASPQHLELIQRYLGRTLDVEWLEAPASP